MEETVQAGATREDRLLYNCSRQVLERDNLISINECLSSVIDWEYILRISEAHGVSPIIYNSLASVSGGSGHPECIPRAVACRFQEAVVRNIAFKKWRSEGVSRLLDLCTEKGIDVMLIKGAALDQLVYDKAWYTTSSDVDLIIRQNREELDGRDKAAIGALCAKYRFECDAFRHEDLFWLSRGDYELMWRDARRLKCAMGEAFFLSQEDMLITSCLNACKRKFFRLKNLIDVAEILRKFGTLRWDVVAEHSRRFRCANMVYTALLVARSTVGPCSPRGDLARILGVHPLRAAVIEFVVDRMLTLRLSTLHRGFSFRRRKYHISVVLPYAAYDGFYLCRRFWYGLTGKGNAFERF